MNQLLPLLLFLLSACVVLPLTEEGAKVRTLAKEEMVDEKYEIIGEVREEADDQNCDNSLRNLAAVNGADYISIPKYEYFLTVRSACRAIAVKNCNDGENCKTIEETLVRHDLLQVFEVPTATESWFIIWGIGLGDSRYSRDSKNSIHNFTGTDYNGLVTTQLTIEYLKTLKGNSSGLGISLSLSQEALETKDRGVWFSSFETLSAVAYQYLGGQIGKGKFFKYQTGISQYTLDKDATTHVKRTGASGGAGIGWAYTRKNLGRSLLFDFEIHYHYSKDIQKGDYTFNMYLMF